MELLNLKTESELEELTPAMKWKQGHIPVTYESMGVDLSITDMWPSYFACRPMVGDLVESTAGRRLIIKEVIHTIENSSAIIRVSLGKDTGTSEPEAGIASENDW